MSDANVADISLQEFCLRKDGQAVSAQPVVRPCHPREVYVVADEVAGLVCLELILRRLPAPVVHVVAIR